jgi:hypothetical protein
MQDWLKASLHPLSCMWKFNIFVSEIYFYLKNIIFWLYLVKTVLNKFANKAGLLYRENQV